MRRSIGGQLRVEDPVDLPLGGDFLTAFEEADSESGEVGGAEGGGFGDFWANHRHAKQIGLELEKEIISRRAAVDA